MRCEPGAANRLASRERLSGQEAGSGRPSAFLAKNTQRIALLLGFTNLLIAGRYATA